MNSNFESLFAAAEHLTGFLLVLLTLCLLWGLTELLGRLSTRYARETVRPSAEPVAQATPESTVSSLPPDDLVVVAAAVAVLIDEPHHIVSVRSQGSSWGQQGRRDIHASHRIR
jgi:Na+-transporting methylmalonyl-CoA/oxaloacetate decarboxylase gamma subunit